MRKVIMLIHLISIWTITNAQWTWQNPLPQGNSLIDVKFISSTVGWAVGYNGTIIKTTDGGITWQTIPYLTEEILYCICFSDDLNGFAVGENGVLLRTTDGGVQWTLQILETTNTLFGVGFIDRNNGIITGEYGTILKTTDGGNTWTEQTGVTSAGLRGIAFIDEEKIILTSEHGTILKSTDGGATWNEQATGTMNTINRVNFYDDNNGIAVGYGATILRTTDGGTTWTQVGNNINYNYDIYESTYIDANNIIAVGGTFIWGYVGIILKSSDAGITWSEIPFESKLLLGLSFIDQSIGIAVGFLGTILRTTDGGTNWIQQTIGTSYDLGPDPSRFVDFYAVDFADVNNGMAVGSHGRIMKTTNGGNTWIKQIIGEDYSFEDVNGVCMTDSNTTIAVGQFGLIVKTTDKGENWTFEMDGVEFWSELKGVSFVNSEIGIVVGYNSAHYPGESYILKTTDGGITWIQQSIPFQSMLNRVVLIDDQNGIIIGNQGLILKTTDGGTTWSEQPSGTDNDLYGISFTDVNTGTIAGYYGTILRTTDAGYTWVQQESGTTYPLLGVSFIDANNGIVVGVGAGSTILKTTNGGTSWIRLSSVSSLDLYDISYIDLNSATAVGIFGSIIATRNDGGTVFINEDPEETILTEFNLSQNYPNPFNPATKIKFGLPESAHTKLIVYDLLGREVQTLINQELGAGFHEITFDAGKLSGGIYFYRIEAGNFTDTKKFVLLK